MTSKIVLGYPYSGAMYWLLSAEEYYHKSIKDPYDGKHPYYKNLFGKNHHQIVDELVSLSLLFEEIYLSPADTFMPGTKTFQADKNYSNTDLGIFTSWQWQDQVRELGINTQLLLRDSKVTKILSSVDEHDRERILHDVLIQLHMSNCIGATIFAIPSYLELCKRIQELVLPKENSIEYLDSTQVSGLLGRLFTLSSLKFDIRTLEEFSLLKTSSTINKYGEAFRNKLSVLPEGTIDERDFLKSMLEAINREGVGDKISGALGITSSLTGLVGLILPPAAPILGVGGMGLDGASRLSGRITDRHKWWLFPSKSAELLTKKRIEEAYNRLEEQFPK